MLTDSSSSDRGNKESCSCLCEKQRTYENAKADGTGLRGLRLQGCLGQLSEILSQKQFLFLKGWGM